jgi:superfamily I DNA and RNA helicase
MPPWVSVGKIRDALAPSFSLVPSIRPSVNEREAMLVQMTHEQAKVVAFLDEQPLAAVHGAAGTGKTMIALEKARRPASPSESVLFLCYNNSLQRHLQAFHSHPNLHFATFHGFAREMVGPNGTLEEAEETLLALLIDDVPLPYTHLIVDEGQDFKTEWLECLAHRFREATFYVFYDRNQLVQKGER